MYSVKTLASSLKSPTTAAWNELGRLIGYMKQTECFSLEMQKTVKGCSFLETLHGVCSGMDVDRPSCLETFSDADWSGSGNQRSTSSAVHVLNGVVIHSSSRTQKCISVSSTESEWYAASAGTCDGLYLHHISGLCDDDVSCLVLHTDNSAVKMLSVKLGAGRLRHIKGRLLWLQDKVEAGDLQIKQVRASQNIADLSTKALSRDRFYCLLYMFGFTVNGEKVGEAECRRMQTRDLLKQQVRIVSEVVSEAKPTVPTSKLNKFAKQTRRGEKTT